MTHPKNADQHRALALLTSGVFTALEVGIDPDHIRDVVEDLVVQHVVDRKAIEEREALLARYGYKQGPALAA